MPAPPGCRTVVTQSCRKIPVEVQKKLPDEKCEEVPDIVCHLELEKYEVVLTNIYLCCRGIWTGADTIITWIIHLPKDKYLLQN